MIVQGANDPRVKKAEADQIVIALRERNYPVQYLLAPDEGHGFARPVNNMAMFAEGEKFLAKYLGGRYQESVTSEVAKRISEITVDPKTVVLAKPIDTNAAPGGNISGKWTFTVDAGGQIVELYVDFKQTGDDFTGTMTSTVSNGAFEKGKVNGSNVTATLNADVQGSPATIQMEGKLDGGKLTGTLNVPGLGVLPFSAVKSN
jgi:hypothetical protein